MCKDVVLLILTYLFFFLPVCYCRRRRCLISALLLSSRNLATMVTSVDVTILPSICFVSMIIQVLWQDKSIKKIQLNLLNP